MSSERPTTISVVGGPLVAGHGDGRGLGWVGRVTARTLPSLPHLRVYPLAVPDEDSAGLHARAMGESALRFTSEGDNRLVLALGSGDLDTGRSVARARLDVANVLDEALARKVSAFVVGPPPEHSAERNRGIAELNTSFTDVAKRRGIAYVDTFTPLLGHPVWQREIASSRDHLPAQEGYGLLAWLVLHRGWFDWLGVEDVLGDD
ncbi:GDSL-type esterase/lipase family protein [Brevibacterium sp.]|uniref:GDSL-type esterase/lipase family protein n=1 Tax=Brevibacterium sp. TaxID=1701 RepID=UPI002810D0C3|nr:GDSL-type esterase/lipase family protein [Brevibacterium sp.]